MKQISGVKWHSNHWYITFNKISIERLAELYKDAEIYPDEYIKYFLKTENIYIKNIMLSEIKELLSDVDKQLILRGYSPKTRKAYLGHIRRLSLKYYKNPKEITNEELQRYLLQLISKDEKSTSYTNQAVSSIKFLYNVVYNRTVEVELPRPKKKKHFQMF